jgi:dihydroorotate dehydrogenase
MYRIFKFFIFLFNPERAHHISFWLFKQIFRFPFLKKLWKKSFIVEDRALSKNVFGIDFPNPVGLAAGLDKNATMFREMSGCGFGFIEIGTVTPKPQSGNEKPRLFRLKKDQAIINRMGFNNDGVDAIVARLKNRPKDIIIGGNIGKNKTTPNENAIDDYLICFNALHSYVDYFVVNVSSPNTPNLRDLQEKEPLKILLSTLIEENNRKEIRKPILLKIAPDLSEHQLDDIIEIVQVTGIQGVIATNTTISREDLTTDKNTIERIGMGGLSGKPLSKRSTEVIKYLHEKSEGSFPIIGVGGVHSESDALDKMAAGASLIQLYTGFIYEGPGLIKRINKAIICQKQ